MNPIGEDPVARGARQPEMAPGVPVPPAPPPPARSESVADIPTGVATVAAPGKKPGASWLLKVVLVALGVIACLVWDRVEKRGGVAPSPRKTGRATLQPDGGPVAGRAWTVPELNMELVYIAEGSFQMGSNNGDSDEQPVRAVRISRAFWLGRYEVTQAEYEKLLGKNPSRFKSARNPVETVSWHDAAAFCAQLTDREQAAERLPAGYEYRLPKEAEWEHACRAGTTGDFAGPLDEIAWYRQNSGSRTHEVGTKKPNAWGLYDMHGNVWEWCLDWYDADYYGRSPGTDPVNLQAASGRVFRGGGWGLAAGNIRAANRVRCRPEYAVVNLGFRACLAPRAEGE